MKAAFFSILSVIAVGCATGPVRNQAELFRDRGGDEASDYEMLAPVSVEAIEYFTSVQFDTVEAFIDGVDARLEDPEELRRYVRDIREINERARLERDPDWPDFVERLRPEDELYLFGYYRNYRHEFGLLVLRDGEIVFRTVWESAAPEGTDPDRPRDPEIDRL